MSEPTQITLQFRGRQADGTASQGWVEAALSGLLYNTSGALVAGPAPVVAELAADGTASLTLYACDDPATSPAGLYYTFTLHLDGETVVGTRQLLTANGPTQRFEDLPVPAGTDVTYGVSSITSEDGSVQVTLLSGGVVDLSVAAGGGTATDADLIAWAAAEAWAWDNVAYDSDDVITSADLTWPDGSAGTFTSTTIDSTWLEITAWTASHTDSGKTVTYGTLTRDASGHIIDPPATYSVA